MVVTGEVFIDAAMYERSLRAAFAHATRVQWVQAGVVSAGPVLLSLGFFWPMTVGYVLIMLAVQIALPRVARRVSVARYRRAGPGMWYYQLDEVGFRVVGPLGIVAGHWPRLGKVTATGEFWVVRPRLSRFGVALPKAAFTPADVLARFAGTMAG